MYSKNCENLIFQKIISLYDTIFEFIGSKELEKGKYCLLFLKSSYCWGKCVRVYLKIMVPEKSVRLFQLFVKRKKEKEKRMHTDLSILY